MLSRMQNLTSQRIKTWMLKREPPTNFTHVASTLSGVIGVFSFVWAVQLFFEEKRSENDREDRNRALQALDRASEHARREKPRRHLREIKRGMLNNFTELEDHKQQQQQNHQNVFSLLISPWYYYSEKNYSSADDDVDLLADSWLQRRNAGQEWAVELDNHRTSLKNMWFSIMLAYDRTSTKNAAVFNDLLFGEFPLGKEIALKTLLALEPLDKAACRANVSKTAAGECDWCNHAPKYTKFIRRVYDVPSEWPHAIGVKTKDEYAQQDDLLIKTNGDGGGVSAVVAAKVAEVVEGGEKKMMMSEEVGDVVVEEMEMVEVAKKVGIHTRKDTN